MRRIYISRERGYAWLLTVFGWDIIVRRRVAGERWRTAPPRRAVETKQESLEMSGGTDGTPAV